jgi:bifunctional UDP-N-acetylglucosamine pyrophosphorylase / glucosamine-1-phosphate N-acetyltransferase
MKTVPVILAAGQGTRMRSKKPKVLHSLMGQPMILYQADTARKVTGETPVLVIGQAADEVRHLVRDNARYVVQEQQLGTGHALQQVESLLRGSCDYILVTYADMPLITSATLQQILTAHIQQAIQGIRDTPITLLTLHSSEARGFGRVIRDENGNVQAIVEEANASPEQLRSLELNASVYCFTADWLWQALPRIQTSPKGEYYLTDLVEIAVSDGLSVKALILNDPDEAIGINTRVHLAEAESALRRRINQTWMLAGVTLIDPASTYIETQVEIGADTVIWPNTYLHGTTRIGEGCTIGPNAIIRDTQIGNRCQILFSFLEKATLEDQVEVGPFARLRKGAHLAEGVHMGNFGEIKNSYLGPGTKMGHFSYIGDATIGPEVNIGAGAITCNFDGKKKSPTEIGAGAFIGSDTMLVAPVKIGEGSSTGAGAVVTKDVPPNTLAVGMPARAIRKLKKSD